MSLRSCTNRRSDALVAGVFASATSVRVLSGGLDALVRAWQSSAARRISIRASGASDIRALAALTVCAGATAVALQALSARPDPNTWMVPAVMALTAAIVFAAAPADSAGVDSKP